jgi:hypothetical protein
MSALAPSRAARSTVMSTDLDRKFDFRSEAELFPPRIGKQSRRFRYQRFTSAAEAVRFAVEHMPAQVLAGVVIEAGDTRLDSKDIRRLYDSADFPLARNG